MRKLKLKSTVAASTPKITNLREATGTTIDSDDKNWRRLTDDSKRDLSGISQDRMAELAIYLWRSNGLANRVTELPLAFILGEGVTLTVKDEEAQDWVNKFWHDPINNLSAKIIKKARELSLYGEQCWPVFKNEINGHLRLGYLDPGQIQKVIMDPDNCEQPIGIITRKDKKGRFKRYKVIINGEENVFTENTQKIRESFTDGECFYYTVNALSNQTRGSSDLLPSIDWHDALELAMFNDLERWQEMRAFIWDVKLTGATPEEVAERAKKIHAPNPGSVRIHNDMEEWNAVSPDLKAGDSEAQSRVFKNRILGAHTIPEHWFGSGGDVNRATAGEMGEPVFKIFKLRQCEIGEIIRHMADYVIRSRLNAMGMIEMLQLNPDEFKVNVEFPRMVSKDIAKISTAFSQVVASIGSAVNQGLMSREMALRFMTNAAAEMDIEIDTSAELERIIAEKEAQQDADHFSEDAP